MIVNLTTPVRNLNRVLEDLGFSTGHSGAGWSHWSAAFECPQKFRYMEAFDTEPSEAPGPKALEVGILFHLFAELRAKKRNLREIESVKERCLDGGASADHVFEAWRVFLGYWNHYQDDPLLETVLGVEQKLCHPYEDYTARLDLFVKLENATGFLDGYYIVDYKTTSRFDSTTLENWMHHGEFLGQQWLIQELLKEEPDGIFEFETIDDFRGTIVDVVGKQKAQKFQRVLVPYDPFRVQEFVRSWKLTRSQMDIWRQTDFWPKNPSACIRRYGVCSFYDTCWI